MNDFKKLALVAAIIAGLALIGSLMNSQQSAVRAAGGPTVTIDATQLPLPVQGSLGVSGTIAAKQSGTWNVGVTGTPNVNVTNPATAPALTLDISKSASQHVGLLCVLDNGAFTCIQGGGIAPYVVPAGQNLIVNSVDIATSGGGGTGTFAIIPFAPLVGGQWAFPNDGFAFVCVSERNRISRRLHVRR